MTRSFLVYMFSQKLHLYKLHTIDAIYFLLKTRLTYTVQYAMCWYTWNFMVGIPFKIFWSVYLPGISIRGHWAQQIKTHFQWDKAYFYDGYAHLVAISRSDAVWNIWFPCGVTVFVYVSNKQFSISPSLMFCALHIWSLSFPKHSHAMIIMMNVCFCKICNT